MPGAAEIELYRTETTNYRDNLASGAPLLWVALRPTGVEPPYEIVAVTADPAEGEALTEAGNDLVDVGADAGGGPRGRRSLRGRASCRAAVLQAQARPRRSGGAGAPRAAAARVSAMSEPENFSVALVAPQARSGRGRARRRRRRRAGAGGSRRARRHGDDAQGEARAGPPARRTRPSLPFDSRELPPIESITAETDIRAFLRAGRAGRTDPCGASPRLGGRSRRSGISSASPDYDWDFNAPGAIPGFGPLEMTDELRRQVAQIVGSSLAEEVARETSPLRPPRTRASNRSIETSIPNWLHSYRRSAHGQIQSRCRDVAR